MTPHRLADQTTVTLPEPGWLSALVALVVAGAGFCVFLLSGGKKLAQLDANTKDAAELKKALTALSEKMDERATEGRAAQQALVAHLDVQFQHLHEAIQLIAATSQDHEKRIRDVERPA